MRERGALRIGEIPAGPRLYIILAPYQVRITPRAVASPSENAITPCRETHVLSEIETRALVRRRNGFAPRAPIDRDERRARAMRCSLLLLRRDARRVDRPSGEGLRVGGHNGEVMAGHGVDADNMHAWEIDRTSGGATPPPWFYHFRCVVVLLA